MTDVYANKAKILHGVLVEYGMDLPLTITLLQICLGLFPMALGFLKQTHNDEYRK